MDTSRKIVAVTMSKELIQEHLFEIERILNAFFDNKYNKQVTEEMLSVIAQQGGQIIGAFCTDNEMLISDTLLGLAFVAPVQTLSRRMLVYEELFVWPDYRRFGVAQAIESRMLEVARETGCDSIELLTNPGNIAVESLHLKNGFQFRHKHCMLQVLKCWEARCEGGR